MSEDARICDYRGLGKIKMPRHDERVDAKIAGATWNGIRRKVQQVSGLLLATGEETTSELTTIYVKYKIARNPRSSVFAVMWIKSAKQVVLGLATPEKIDEQGVKDAPKGMSYAGLTSYVGISEDRDLPARLPEWIELAYEQVASSAH